MSDASINICKRNLVITELRFIHATSYLKRYLAWHEHTYWTARLAYLRAERRLARNLRSNNKHGKRTVPIDRVRVKAYLEMTESIRRRLWELERKALKPSARTK